MAAAPVYPAAAHAVAPARTVAAPQAAARRPGARPRPADSEPLVAPPPDPAPYTGNDEPPVSVGAGPQVSSGGTAAPDDAPAADKAPVPDAAVGEAPDDAGRPGRDAGPAAVDARAEPRPVGGRGARRSRGVRAAGRTLIRAGLAVADRYLEPLEHEELVVRRGRRSGLYTIVAVHSTVRGPSLGGCRMWGYGDARAAVRDALRLSRAMTFKSAVADLPLGGGKGVIMLPAGAPPPAGERPPRRAARLRRRDRASSAAAT